MRKKLGDWILDVSKYIVTVGLLAPMLQSEANYQYTLYYCCIVGVVIVLVSIGLFLSDDDGEYDDNDKKNNNQKRMKK